MERLTYDFCIGGNHCWQVKGADNLECREVCEKQGDDGCKTCPIAKAFDRLAAIEDILGEEYDLEQLRKLWFADQKGHCVVFDEHYPVVSEYYRDEEGRYIRESSGVISEAEYKKAMGDG